jgi:hypothetical protein
LCTMSINQFHVEVLEAIEIALKLLFPQAAPVSRKQANGSRRNRKSRSVVGDHIELNEKQQRVRPNWNSDMCSSPTSPSSDTVIRWKGKDRVRIRREHNLDAQA